MPPQATTDPYASIATPIAPAASSAAPAASADPYASIATPINQPAAPPRSILQRVEDVGIGAAKGLGDTLLTGAHMVPMGAEGHQFLQTLDDKLAATNTEQKVGKGLETAGEMAATAGATSELTMAKELAAAEKLTGAARAAKYVDLARKYPILAQTFNMATDHPWLSKMILEGGKNAVVGGTEGVVKTHSVKGAATGAAVGAGTGAAFAAAPLLLNPFKKAASAITSSDIWRGPQALMNEAEATTQAGAKTAADTTQAGAESALRSGVQEGAGVPVAQPQNLREVLDQPISALEDTAKQNYQAMDKATGGKFQPNVDALKNVNDELRGVTGTNPAREAELEASKIRLEWQRDQLMNEAEKNGVPKATVQLAKGQFRQAQALQALDTKVFKNFNVVDLDGNVKVDNALKALQKLKDDEKWGAPRLDQAVTKDVADVLIDSLKMARQQGKDILDQAGKQSASIVTRAEWAAAARARLATAAKLGGAGIVLTYGKDVLHVILGI